MERSICACNTCKGACTTKPGWLKFGDEIIIAKELNLSVKELFQKHLLVDWWQDNEGQDYYGLTPCVTRISPGGMFTFNPRGQCVFFKDELCDIHSVSPFECGAHIHTDSDDQVMNNHRQAAQTWNCEEGKRLIKELLGKDPEPPTPHLTDLLGMFE